MCKKKNINGHHINTVLHGKIINSVILLPLFLAHMFLLINNKEHAILKLWISVIHNNLVPRGSHVNAQSFQFVMQMHAS